MYRVDGFEFETKEMAELAQKESDGIKYIKEQTRMDAPDVVLKLYRKLIDKQIFDTPVGYTFLYDLYEYLHTIPYIKNEDIPCIPVATHAIEVLSKTNKKARKKEEEKEKKEHLIKKLKDGENIAIVTDAGTPGISDPGEVIVKKAIEEGINVIPIPGACAAINALITSGLDTKEFVFIGFLE